MPKEIKSFRGPYRWLSNYADGSVEVQGLVFQNREAAFQAAKTVRYSDTEKFFNLFPKEARELGRQVELRPGWEEMKYDVMEIVCQAYFDQHKDMREKLIETGDAYLEEGTTGWCDTYWGVCNCPIHNGEGQNNLGKILMKIRDQYISELKEN